MTTPYFNEDRVPMTPMRGNPNLYMAAEEVSQAREADRLAGLMAQRARLDEQIAKMAARPAEPDYGEDGTSPMVVFDKTFGDEVAQWTYVGLKTRAGYWVLSGAKQTKNNYTWQGLLDFAESQEPDLPTIWLVTGLAPL